MPFVIGGFTRPTGAEERVFRSFIDSVPPDGVRASSPGFAPHCADSELPRTLAARLRKAGLVVKDVSYFPIVNLDRYHGCYGEMVVPFILAYVKGQKTVPDYELQAWADEQAALNARGEHFFSTGRFSFAIKKPTE
jgi:hypothetical protein